MGAGFAPLPDAAAPPADSGASLPCGFAEAEPNDSSAAATAYVAESAVTGCLGSEADVDVYLVTAPAGDAGGGFYVGAVTGIEGGQVDVSVLASPAGTPILGGVYSAAEGAPVRFHFAAAPGEQYEVRLTRFAQWIWPVPYTLQLQYTAVVDAHEPNDTVAEARAVAAGSPVQAHVFAGFRSGALRLAAYDDWFAVELRAGTATFRVEGVPADVAADLLVLDSKGRELAHEHGGAKGASVVYKTPAALAAGSYRVKVAPQSLPLAADKGPDVPASFTTAYTFTVIQ
jgi:hypothetical protein